MDHRQIDRPIAKSAQDEIRFVERFAACWSASPLQLRLPDYVKVGELVERVRIERDLAGRGN